MSKLLLLISCIFLVSAVAVETVYVHAVMSIEGVNKPLSVYQGKKMLIMTLPTQQNASNDSLLHSLDSLGTKYYGSVVIIGVPAYEDGFTAANKNNLKAWYRSKLGQGIIITNGLYTRKTSGNQQHPLFKFLTDKNRNAHFNEEVTGPGNKFIIWSDGELVGVLGSQTRIGGAVVNDLLQQQ